MAVPFSSATSLRSLCQPTTFNSPKALLPIRDSAKRCSSTTNVSFSSSASSYVGFQNGSIKFSSIGTKKLVQRRFGVCYAATEEAELEKIAITKDAKTRMEKTLDSIRENFDAVKTGRANPSMLDRVEVEYYGTPVSLKTIAQISTPDASSLLIQPFDKSSLKIIEKAIVTSDLGVTPNNDGDVIRLSIPPLTSDGRKELTKVVAKQAEEGKVAIRNVRRDVIKAYEKLEKEKKLSKDNLKDLTGDVQKLTDEYMKKIETILKQKEKELMTV